MYLYSILINTIFFQSFCFIKNKPIIWYVLYLRYHCCLPCWSEEIYFKYSKESDNQVWSRNHKHWRRVWHKHGKIHGSSGWSVFIYLDLYDKERSKGVYWRICWWQANCLDVHVWTDCSLGKYYWKPCNTNEEGKSILDT